MAQPPASGVGPRLTTFVPSASHSTTYRQHLERKRRRSTQSQAGSTHRQVLSALLRGWKECLEWEWEMWDRRLQLLHSLLLLVSLHLSSHPTSLGRLSHLRVFPLLFRRNTRRGFVRRLAGIVHLAEAGRKVGVLLGLREKVQEVIEHRGGEHPTSSSQADRLRLLEKPLEPHEMTPLHPISEVLLSLAEMMDLLAFLGVGGLGSWRLWRRADGTKRGALRSFLKRYVAMLSSKAEGLQKWAVVLALVALTVQQFALLRIFASLKARMAELKSAMLEVIDEEAGSVVEEDDGDGDDDAAIVAQAEKGLAALTEKENVDAALESSRRILGAPSEPLSVDEVMGERRGHGEADAIDEVLKPQDEKLPPTLFLSEASPLQRLETALQTTKQRARSTYLDLLATRAEMVHAAFESVLLVGWPGGTVHDDEATLRSHQQAERRLEWVEGLTGMVAGACGILKGA